MSSSRHRKRLPTLNVRGIHLPGGGQLGWIFLGLALTILLAPLPFGSITPLWKALLAGISLLLLAASAFSAPRQYTWPPHGIAAMTPAALLFLAACAWAAVQAVSWTPTAWHHPSWRLAAPAIEAQTGSAISIYPDGTLLDLLSLLGLGATFLVALMIAREPAAARRLLATAALAGFAYAVYGLIIFLSGNETVAWVEKTAYAKSVSSTFINRNTYAVFSGLGILCAAGLLVSAIAPAFSNRMRRSETWHIVLVYLTGKGTVWPLAIVAGLSALLMTGSRAGTAASLTGVILALVIYLGSRKARPSTFAAFILSALVVGISFITLSGDLLIDRLGSQTSSWDARVQIYETTLLAIRDNMWLGSGYGTFEDIYRLYAGLNEQFGVTFKAAHNVYLEHVLELGVPAALALFTSIGFCIWVLARAIVVRQRDRIYPAVALGATAIVGLQGLVDFAVQTPAVAHLYVIILATGVAQSTSRRGNGRDGS